RERRLGKAVGRCDRGGAEAIGLEGLREGLEDLWSDLLRTDQQVAYRAELVEQGEPATRAAQEARGRPVVQQDLLVERVDHRSDETHVVEQWKPRETA